MHESININRINHFLQETNNVVIIPIKLPQLGSAPAMMNGLIVVKLFISFICQGQVTTSTFFFLITKQKIIKILFTPTFGLRKVSKGTINVHYSYCINSLNNNNNGNIIFWVQLAAADRNVQSQQGNHMVNTGSLVNKLAHFYLLGFYFLRITLLPKTLKL